MTSAVIKRSHSSRQFKSKYVSPHRKSPHISEHNVNVTFRDKLSTEQVVAEISHLSNPQVIVWYVGCYGLREAGVKFYRDFLISPTLNENSNATFWLVDLTAWSAFKNPQCSITKAHSCCDAIEKFSDHRIKCIRSAKIFRKMQEMSEKDFFDYFNKALCRDFISKTSRNFPNKNILVKEIFPKSCTIASQWKNHDVSKAYSIFQYLEGCLLVDEILTQDIMSQDIQLVFALPNDEFKYYKDKQDSFRKDIEFLISKRCSERNVKKISLNIQFLSFKYGSHSHERPYNAQGETLKNKNLTADDIIGYIEEMPQGQLPYANKH